MAGESTWATGEETTEAETTSGFAVPEGLALAPAESDHPSSEFAVPEGLSVPPRPQQRSEFTPSHGVPAFSRGTPWQDRMRTMVRLPLAERPAPEAPPVVAEGEPAPPVPRVLDLTLRIGELLLAGGEGAEDVEAAMFGVAHAYGLDRCDATVTFTLISITHQPSLVDPSVSLSRTVRRRGTDYTRLAAVFQLVDDITSGEVSLEEAYGRLAQMRRNRHPFTKWQLTMAAGLLAGAASVLVGGGWQVFVLAVIGAMVGDRLAWLAAGRGLPEFYQFVAAAMAPALVGVVWAASHTSGQGEKQAAAMITGGLFALIPGRALVAGVQDGLTGYYLTASARLLEVIYLSVGIVCGVLGVLYIGETSGVRLDPEVMTREVRPVTQLAAALLLSLSFCVLLQQERSTVLLATVNGGIAWLVYGAMHDTAGLSPFAATAVAAGMVGLFGQLQSRYQFTSSLPYVTAAIGPLLPGSAFYLGLLGFAQGNVDFGLENLLRAVTLALAIAVGVNLGGEMARLFIKTPGLTTPIGRRGAKRTRGF
ncbi:threonine/serine exporter family protein [Streptomyces sp. DSM 44915]|uniref:Threonine/serine exporter family protein n=1 Tax=Streptomyces chisholmiae TaxID=3075540 RepID=A0ABU2JXP0_9ACTN|nr:threonine/serine exporter family protein [Streptomyces sp. DSM 44915]MDT0269514.1 threonine/serine exporter family protein [Streptomyces sp. DSM 44915]